MFQTKERPLMQFDVFMSAADLPDYSPARSTACYIELEPG